ncbi:hypothetical protein ACIBEK_10965 [Nocardia fusca]|jgi:hypothetical protein|uniref:Uncharacterized protein n=1 Tax=Nocardia fusca TaxID=941183 RepID=A0ABV3F795_9NOCA|nr:hypothetical protein [Nocardia fusca]
MSSEDLNRQIPDELFRKVSAKPERALPDALFGPAPEREADGTADDTDAAEDGDVRKAV